jgi:hypothetical protein
VLDPRSLESGKAVTPQAVYLFEGQLYLVKLEMQSIVPKPVYGLPFKIQAVGIEKIIEPIEESASSVGSGEAVEGLLIPKNQELTMEDFMKIVHENGQLVESDLNIGPLDARFASKENPVTLQGVFLFGDKKYLLKFEMQSVDAHSGVGLPFTIQPTSIERLENTVEQK